jgi:hypothetical protein
LGWTVRLQAFVLASTTATRVMRVIIVRLLLVPKGRTAVYLLRAGCGRVGTPLLHEA